MVWEEFDKDMIVTGLRAKSKEELFEALGGLMIKKGVAKKSFIEALGERERENPTGIDMGGFGIAIPHTDPSHVIRDGICAGVLEEPVTFAAMGTDDEYVEARLAFVLAITDADSHLDRLQALLRVLQDRETLAALSLAKSPGEFIEIIKASDGSPGGAD